MAVATRPRSSWDWHSPWFFLLLGALLVVGSVLGVGFGTGLFGRGGQVTPPPTAHSPAVTASPSESPSPSPSPSPPSPSPSPTPASVVSQLHGKIAISNGQPGSGGWITFPGGQFTSDSGSNVSIEGNGWTQGLTHDLALNRWLPVQRDWVTPDGKSYVYSTGTSINLVTPGQGTRTLKVPVLSSGDVYWQILAATPSGVYVTPPPYGYGAGSGGLYRIGYTGDPRLITLAGYWSVTDGTYAYGTLTSDVPQGAATTVVRLTIATGAVQTVFSQPGMRSAAVGIAAGGAPVILALESASLPTLAQIWIAGAGSPVKIYETTMNSQPSMGPFPQMSFNVFSVVGDSVGTWISTSKGLYLYSKEAGLELASTVTGPLASAFRAS